MSMTIDEATKVLKDILTNVEPGDPPEEHDAIKLGIEALKRCKWLASLRTWENLVPLPGETEE